MIFDPHILKILARLLCLDFSPSLLPLTAYHFLPSPSKYLLRSSNLIFQSKHLFRSSNLKLDNEICTNCKLCLHSRLWRSLILGCHLTVIRSLLSESEQCARLWIHITTYSLDQTSANLVYKPNFWIHWCKQVLLCSGGFIRDWQTISRV